MKKINFFHYDALLHLSCLRKFNEEEQFQIIDEAEKRAGSLIMKNKRFFSITFLTGFVIAALLYYWLRDTAWSELWLVLWFSFVVIFLSGSRKRKHLSPYVEQVAKEKSNCDSNG